MSFRTADRRFIYPITAWTCMFHSDVVATCRLLSETLQSIHWQTMEVINYIFFFTRFWSIPARQRISAFGLFGCRKPLRMVKFVCDDWKCGRKQRFTSLLNCCSEEKLVCFIIDVLTRLRQWTCVHKCLGESPIPHGSSRKAPKRPKHSFKCFGLVVNIWIVENARKSRCSA